MTNRWPKRFGFSVAALAGLLAAGCGGARESRAAAGRPAVAVEVVPAAVADLVEAVEVVGSLAPKVEAEIKSEYTGIVTAVEVKEWVAVRRGQVLARLDVQETEADVEASRAALLQAEVASVRAARELERAGNLKAVGLMTQQGLDDARTAKDAAEASRRAAEAQLRAAEARLTKLVVRAPFDGVVAFRGVDVGDRVESMGSGDPMFRVVDSRLLELTVMVPAVQLAPLRAGQPVEFTTDIAPGRTFTGRVKSVNPGVEAASRSARVVADVPNPTGELRGGCFVKGRILTGARSGVLQVPRPALQSWDVAAGTAEVFVVKGDVASRRPVRTGAVAGDSVEVVSGVAAGERVVTRGAFALRDGDRVKLPQETD